MDGSNSVDNDLIIPKEVCVDVSKIEKNKKRGEYQKFSNNEKALIRKYASKNRVANAVRHILKIKI